ncbi:MAG: tRNA pseudouridine(55) synthase TruB [Candidatus Borkfalkiaceae bacterium]|nr:tRNA pseudouridine(55) synthase TruB [Clostridia bacterium]MDY6223191.1 tRNA pseudouridine(55) synthase TruB [Christensenellaceae bacterium]
MNYTRKIKTFGFINLNKPTGRSSALYVAKVKRLTGQPCGHLGTLDPLANGVLPVGIGNANRLFDYFLNKKKEYVAQFTFGETSDTLDSTGIIERGGTIPRAEEIAKALPAFIGETDQVPPDYSAKSVNGRRGYALARAGVEFTLPSKRVRIDRFELLGEGEDKNSYRFLIECGAGTYIRSLARDLAAALGTQALMSALTRTKSGVFFIENAVSPDVLTEENVESFIIPTESVLPFPRLTADKNNRVFTGVKTSVTAADGEYKLYRGEDFYGMATVKNGAFYTVTKLC